MRTRTLDMVQPCRPTRPRINPSQLLWDLCALSYGMSIGRSIPHQKMFGAIAEKLSSPGDAHWLDAGCGAGFFEAFLQQQRSEVAVDGIDFSAQMVQRARRKFTDARYRFAQANLDEPLPYPPATFDAIVCTQVFFALPHPEVTLNEFARILKPQGKLVIVDPKPESNMGFVALTHLREAIQLKGMARLRTLGQTLVAFPFALVVLLLNVIMDIWVRKGTYHFYDTEAITALCQQHGFSVEGIDNVLAQQDTLVVAILEK